jgi:hypothetical protein
MLIASGGSVLLGRLGRRMRGCLSGAQNMIDRLCCREGGGSPEAERSELHFHILRAERLDHGVPLAGFLPAEASVPEAMPQQLLALNQDLSEVTFLGGLVRHGPGGVEQRRQAHVGLVGSFHVSLPLDPLAFVVPFPVGYTWVDGCRQSDADSVFARPESEFEGDQVPGGLRRDVQRLWGCRFLVPLVIRRGFDLLPPFGHGLLEFFRGANVARE